MAKKITNPAILALNEAAALDPARGRVWIGLDVGLKSQRCASSTATARSSTNVR